MPTIVERTPYGKHDDEVVARAARIARRGFAVVVQDIRGRYMSDGDFRPFFAGQHDDPDGFDCVQWVAAEEWSNGRVGVMGHSYSALMAWELAYQQPPALGALFVGGMVGDSRDVWPGAFRVGRQLYWSLVTLGANLAARDARDEASFRAAQEKAEARWAECGASWMRLPMRNVPERELGALAPYWKDWVENHHHDWFRLFERIERIHVPVKHFTGWHDRFVEGVRLFEALAGRDDYQLPHELVIGPWTHEASFKRGASVGDLDLGDEAQVDLEDVAADWFARTLRGSPPSTPTPCIDLFVMGTNEWLSGSEWPFAGSQVTNLYLSGNEKRLGRLVSSPSEQSAMDLLVDFDDPMPSVDRPDFHCAPLDLRPVWERSDYVSYFYDARSPMMILGRARVVLWAEAFARDLDWVVRLVLRRNDGRIVPIARGFLRSSFRDGYLRRVPLEPGATSRFDITLTPTCQVVSEGESLGVMISHSDFPNYERNDWCVSESACASDAESQRIASRILHGPVTPSVLQLPVRPARDRSHR